jgi:uncharacterized membrane protein YfcA
MMMDILLVAISMSIHAAFIWRRKLLFEKKSFVILLALSTLFFFLSYVLLQANAGNPKMVVLIRVPLLALIVFVVMKSVYFKIYDKNPVDTFWTMDIKLMKDGIFNFLFWVIGLLLPIFLTYKVL